MKTLYIQFKNEIEQKELPLFRGAVISTMQDANVLFHNHDKDKLRYSYPLIQYKRISKKAAMVCIEEGTEAIGEFFSNCNFDLQLGNKEMKLEIESVKAGQTLVQIWNEEFTYRIHRWLPFNHVNYQQYQQLDSLADKYAMLEKILIGNILSFLKGIHLYVDKRITCNIVDIDEPYLTNYKGVKLMAYNAIFKCNISFPNYSGLGKGVSLGNGIVTMKHKEQEEKQNKTEQ